MEVKNKRRKDHTNIDNSTTTNRFRKKILKKNFFCDEKLILLQKCSKEINLPFYYSVHLKNHDRQDFALLHIKYICLITIMHNLIWLIHGL